MRSPRWFALVLALGALSPLGASAQQPAQPLQPAHPAALPQRLANYSSDGDLLRASFSYRDVLDPALMKKLSSGLPMVIAMRAYVYREGADVPVALTTRLCRLVYDLWDEVFRVHVTEKERGERDQAVLLDSALRLCTEARDLSVGPRSLIPAGQGYFLGVVVDVNPVSADVVEQMKRWMSRPTGSTEIGPADALFGNFVQLFVRQIATSDKTLTFRTQNVPQNVVP
jgi:hypothetical protein